MKPIAISALIGGLAVVVSTAVKPSPRSTQDLIADFYRTENAVPVSPHNIGGKMDTGDNSFVLVGWRSPQEHQREHIIGPVNITASTDPNTPAAPCGEAEFGCRGDDCI